MLFKPINTWIQLCLKGEKQNDWRTIRWAEEEAHRSVADGGEDVQVSQASQRVDRLQSAAKGFVEYVADPSTSTAAEEMSLAQAPLLLYCALSHSG